MTFTYVKIEVLLPEKLIIPLRDRLNDAGLLRVGKYDHVVSYTHTKGYWRPLKDAAPYSGEKDFVSYGEECKLEFKCLYKNLPTAKKSLKSFILMKKQ